MQDFTFLQIWSWQSIIAIFIGLIGLFIYLGIQIHDKKQYATKPKPDKKTISVVKRADADGLVFGLYKKKIVCSPTSQEGSCIVFGGSGTGKTSAVLIPTLNAWQGTSFTIDISGDISQNCQMPQKIIYTPEDPQTMPYNVFATIDTLTDKEQQNELLEQLAIQLMPDRPALSDASKFYETEGRKILLASLIAFYHQGMDFVQICEKIFQHSWKDLFRLIDSSENLTARQYINSFEGASETNTSGCKQACDAAIRLFATNWKLKKSLRRPKNNETAISPESVETHNVFVCIPDTKLMLYGQLTHLITAQMLDHFGSRSNNSKTNILLAIDEFASFGKLEITDALRKYRKKHVRVMLLTQSLADIDMIYGINERNAILNNCPFKVILSAQDTETQEFFSKLIGKEKHTEYSLTKSPTGNSYTSRETLDYSIEASTLAHLKDQLILLYPNGYLYLNKNYYFK